MNASYRPSFLGSAPKITLLAFVLFLLSAILLSLGYVANRREREANSALVVSESIDSAFYLMGKKGISEMAFEKMSNQQKAETIILYAPKIGKVAVVEAVKHSIPSYYKHSGPYEPPSRGNDAFLFLAMIFAVLAIGLSGCAGFIAIRARTTPVTA
jgi:preprotein translocase subunit SecG